MRLVSGTGLRLRLGFRFGSGVGGRLSRQETPAQCAHTLRLERETR
jgi:hypothetical protein